MRAPKLLPGTGRGTTRRVVERHVPVLLTSEVQFTRPCPSTMVLPSAVLRNRMVPLPLQGRNSA
jgi:hypothetical protein